MEYAKNVERTQQIYSLYCFFVTFKYRTETSTKFIIAVQNFHMKSSFNGKNSDVLHL